MKIYTKTGDKGETGLYGGGRVSKSHPLVESYGTVDELNSVLGIAIATAHRTAPAFADQIPFLQLIQRKLFDLGAELATVPGKQVRWHLSETDITGQEEAIDRLTAQIPEQQTFILPGGTELAAQLHLARTVSRRAERLLVALPEIADHEAHARQIRYLNRLSDLLFTLARYANWVQGVEDIPVV